LSLTKLGEFWGISKWIAGALQEKFLRVLMPKFKYIQDKLKNCYIQCKEVTVKKAYFSHASDAVTAPQSTTTFTTK
jgi:hypothetical protein